MAERTYCPACGAPLEIPENQESVQCSFCNDSFIVHWEDNRPQLQVESQPGPQKDVLTEQANRVLDDSLSDQSRDDGEPVSPGFASLGTSEADPTAVGLPTETRISGAEIYETLDNPDAPAPMPSHPYETSTPGSAPSVPGQSMPAPQGGDRRRQWIIIAIAVFIVTFVLCACVAGALIMVFNISPRGIEDFSYLNPLAQAFGAALG